MADDDVQEFTKDNPPDPGSGSFYRSKKMVFASGPHTNVKLGGKHHKGTGFIIDEAPLENKVGKQTWVDEADFREEYAVASQGDLPYNPGPHFDATEASREQAEGYQMDPNVEGDLAAGQQLQDPRS